MDFGLGVLGCICGMVYMGCGASGEGGCFFSIFYVLFCTFHFSLNTAL